MLKHQILNFEIGMADPAAFGRLCVETFNPYAIGVVNGSQLPSGGCVLKQSLQEANERRQNQLPSGGCVLKHAITPCPRPLRPFPAAFGRLCVETIVKYGLPVAGFQLPSGGCVL